MNPGGSSSRRPIRRGPVGRIAEEQRFPILELL